MKKVFLGNFDLTEKTVIVSDPCYKLGTWCQGKLDNVKPGTWEAVVMEDESYGIFGIITELIAYHKDAVGDISYLEGKWEEQPFSIGVDSGQAGFFQKSVYQNNNTSLDYPDYFRGEPEYEGSRWYGVCCDVTLSSVGAGVIEGGVVSSSGHGDGCYTLYTVEEDGEVIAMKIVFIEEEWACE